ncbi:hypothetical protein [Glycomyces harbinensis]|uniref:hypothetical protein n=1 Tax=Glycomyces harbinensis TaxID=58114 RepID=UPI000B87F92A|nr:hypothetical protein [Glycomyces harbinensis]
MGERACRRGAPPAPRSTAPARVDRPGLVAQLDGTTVTVAAFDITGDHVTRIRAVRNPEKLTSWAMPSAGPDA